MRHDGDGGQQVLEVVKDEQMVGRDGEGGGDGVEEGAIGRVRDADRWELSAAELAAIQADLFEFPIAKPAKRKGE